MIQKLKQEFAEDRDNLCRLLETYGFANIKKHRNYISFGRDEDSSAKSIVIYTDNNESLFLKDYARNKRCDLISYIQNEKGASFKDVIHSMYSILGQTPYEFKTRDLPFGGMFKRRKRIKAKESDPIPESTTDEYAHLPNIQFLEDNIPLRVQKDFGIGFSFEDNCITIPIRRSDGCLVGIKARLNEKKTNTDFKYYYLHPCYMSSILFGLSENYKYLDNADRIFVFESEKSVMQAYGYGFRNAVSIGSSSISDTQAQMLRHLNPSEIVVMHDEGIEKSILDVNCSMLKKHLLLTDISIKVWEPGEDIPDKASPTDLGEERFIQAIKKELKLWKES